jgi:hypothetical protein
MGGTEPANDNIFFYGNEAELKYLGTIVTNQNVINEEIKSKLNLGNACYQSV